MYRTVIAAVTALAVAFCVQAQGTGSKKLPQYWKSLGLTDAQKAEVYKVNETFDKQIADAEAKVKTLKAEKKTKLLAILTDAQKEQLKKIIAEKAGATEPAKDKPAKDK
jgi:hypothetical protein